MNVALLKSVAAIIAGIAFYSLLLFAATWLGNAAFGRNESALINHSVTTQMLWLIWNIVSMAAAGLLTGAIARRATAAHAIAMGTIQAVFTLGAMFTSHRDITPQWLWIALIITTIPAAWFGARLPHAK
jgi:hypothetical protein